MSRTPWQTAAGRVNTAVGSSLLEREGRTGRRWRLVGTKCRTTMGRCWAEVPYVGTDCQGSRTENLVPLVAGDEKVRARECTGGHCLGGVLACQSSSSGRGFGWES